MDTQKNGGRKKVNRSTFFCRRRIPNRPDFSLSKSCSHVLCITFIICLLAPSASFAKIYKYIDENGRVNFTDNPANIPEKNLQNKDFSQRGGHSNKINVRIEGNRVFVPVTFRHGEKETRATLLLDTGAEICTITPDLARRLQLNPGETEMGVAQVVGGGFLPVGMTRIDSLTVGPNEMSKVEVGIISGGQEDGLLGMNFLRNYQYRIDFQESTITWGNF